ncbi:serine carboxypeptidase-like 10 isoform X2 [Chenopodium quinoa]|uniref:serine carboxypeptidase-like 10 isoform X2 n=1 Tax=Chenopodium quinoa TaxID=63459 RepID=UPI000B780C20|nr:serine carboxypeptidase-like 10 isoform X2 [Chenopodium quinoa]
MGNTVSHKLFTILYLLHILTPILHAASPKIVKSVPGFPGILPFYLETGYVGVGDNEEVQLFYYFIKSERDYERDPLMVWLTGGPGCSALSGLVLEIGPLIFNTSACNWHSEAPTFQLNPSSWTKIANIIFLDSPVGTGFSYATNPEGYYSDDITSSRHIYQFLRKGYILGNPFTWKFDSKQSKLDYAHRVSLLSDDLYESTRLNCDDSNDDVDNVKCALNLQTVSYNLDPLFDAHVLRPKCVSHQTWCQESIYYLLENWSNDIQVRAALHIREGTKSSWIRCNKTLAYENNVESTFGYHQNLTQDYIRALIYSGDQDMKVSYVGTLEWINMLNVSISEDWRPWFVNGQVAGYTTKFSNDKYHVTFATVKGAGHTAPEYKRSECFTMLLKWFAMLPL